MHSFLVACEFYSLVVISWNRVRYVSVVYFVQRSIQIFGPFILREAFCDANILVCFLWLFWTTFYFSSCAMKRKWAVPLKRTPIWYLFCRKKKKEKEKNVLNQIYWDSAIRSSHVSLGPVLQNVILKVRFHSAWVEFLNQENMSKDSL